MRVLITGGAGFIGINAAKRFMDEGHQVIIFDNLSRRGSALNLDWLKEFGKPEVVKGDIRDFHQIKRVFHSYKNIDVILHLASQVAVTTSVLNPREDFEINAIGTFNLCEAIRLIQPEAILLNASTNKVYGETRGVEIIEQDGKYVYKNLQEGINEDWPLDLHSPYGCSKGAADQYVGDYARIYNIRAVNFRQSCIYGYRQFGTEDQGWVAWFTICSTLGKPITIYGNGKQVRDVLFIEDLVDCYLKAITCIDKIRGENYNIGGGPGNTLSILGLIALLAELLGKEVRYSFDKWRPGDQKVFICDIRRAEKAFGWKPKTHVREGVTKLLDWVLQNRNLFG